MRRHLLIALALATSLLVSATSAQAIVLDLGTPGRFGVAFTPGTDLTKLTVPAVTSSSACTDPWLPPELLTSPTRLNNGLCYRGGPVLHANETFVLTWDANRGYFANTKLKVQQFLKDVADASGNLATPYGDTVQYRDAGGRAGDFSKYGGACVDLGNAGLQTCDFTGTTTTGYDYPPSGCSAGAGAATCLTDAQLKNELATMIARTALSAHTQPGYSPLIVLLTAPGVETCLDPTGTVCSANAPPKGASSFCSYHSQVTVGAATFAYVVQPWTALTGCDVPNATPISKGMSAEQLATLYGERLVSPLSQSQIAAIVDPSMDGWVGLKGTEVDDGGCVPAQNDPEVPIGSGSYPMQGEFNNTGVLENDPAAPTCVWGVGLQPRFVVPSPLDQGDVVEFDGSTTASTLMVPKAGYVWNFGDGAGAVGPSVLHTYASGGTYSVTLTVTDRTGDLSTLKQSITVLGPGGQTVTPIPSSSQLRVRLQLLPQSVHSMLSSGISVRVSSNEAADGISTLSISRSDARRAHIRTGRGSTVVIGRGTVSGIKSGTVRLQLRLGHAIASKLSHLRHLKLTVRLTLVAAGGKRTSIDVAGSY